MTNRLEALIHQKLQFQTKEAQVATENITNSELKGAREKVLMPFKKILQHAHHAKDSVGRTYRDIKQVKVGERFVRKTSNEISREMTTLQLAKLSHEHDNLIGMLKTFGVMHKTVIGK